ncbi:hypothetical protein [Leekyejoonella antrihumi]|uniref:Uncharacterized protein n=1 Tax=Leekyejoonella antrihumi TaxID=1660198 RepID=A0A563DTW1_9MICO|nr:hypothetical protein [Leekyejoonella antrihumi]TWP33361.1 hypothetical protein FGL98_21610 [Leekyejoonella antrihumi]
MGLRLRIGVFIADHDPAAPPLADGVANSAVLTGAHSIIAYWAQTSRGFVDLSDSELLPPVTITLSRSNLSVREIAQTAIDAHSADSGPTHPVDAFIVLVNPGDLEFTNPGFNPAKPAVGANTPTVVRAFRAAAVPAGKNLPVPVVVVPAASVTFSTLYHEVGHLLGLQHPYGLVTAADDDKSTAVVELSAVYGSPFDIMGVGGQVDTTHDPAWFRFTSTFTTISPFGWSSVGSRVGPNLSLAHLHLAWPAAFAASSVIERNLPHGGVDVTARLVAGRLLVLRSQSEDAHATNRLYLELRTATDWDAGLASDVNDTVREGVVLHQVAYTPDTGDNRLWYRGSIGRDSFDLDTRLPGSAMTVTVTAWGPNWADVQVSVHDNTETVTVELIEEASQLGEPVSVEEHRTPCGSTYETGTWQTDDHSVFEARARGFGGEGSFSDPPLEVDWWIGGRSLGTLRAGPVRVTNSDGTAHIVMVSVDDLRGRLSVDAESGSVIDVEVGARARSAASVAYGSARLTASGSYTGIRPEHLSRIVQCIKDNLPVDYERLRLGPPTPVDGGGFVDWARHRQMEGWITATLDTTLGPPTLGATARSALQRMTREVHVNAVDGRIPAVGTQRRAPEVVRRGLAEGSRIPTAVFETKRNRPDSEIPGRTSPTSLLEE